MCERYSKWRSGSGWKIVLTWLRFYYSTWTYQSHIFSILWAAGKCRNYSWKAIADVLRLSWPEVFQLSQLCRRLSEGNFEIFWNNFWLKEKSVLCKNCVQLSVCFRDQRMKHMVILNNSRMKDVKYMLSEDTTDFRFNEANKMAALDMRRCFQNIRQIALLYTFTVLWYLENNKNLMQFGLLLFWAHFWDTMILLCIFFFQ